MEWLLIGLFAFTAVACTGLAVMFYRQKRHLYRSVNQMIDGILDDKEIRQSDLQEGEVSLLTGKAKRIQAKMQAEIGSANKEKEQVKGLISNMSHQLKTPLANIMMYEEILSSGAVPGNISKGEQAEFLRKMRKQSEKVNWILNSLFKMVKLEQDVIMFEAGSNNIRGTILEAVNLVYERAQKRQTEIVTEDFLDCNLWHNSKWTAEVFANILENAVKYTPEGGKITIGMNRFEMYSQIWFLDNGIGIAQEEQTEIFKRFYRSQEVENMDGSGIGLYLSKLILEKEKGYMNVASRKGEGSCFSVFLQNCL